MGDKSPKNKEKRKKKQSDKREKKKEKSVIISSVLSPNNPLKTSDSKRS
jgi:hypothetical protein